MLNSDNGHARRRTRLDEEAQRVRATILPPRPTSSAYTRIRGRRNAYSPSSIQVRVRDPDAPSVPEQDVINRLQAGEGVLDTELANLFKQCVLCDHYFVATLREVHMRDCLPNF
jgi:hypothetical protein